ncbi:PqiC family protein [Candidatus Binatus sp.]|uniref:PqiC family protein n=1 Tax=Candidatus Binatus sp. TaxID=2811406 RepID=UPI003CC5755E
MARRIAKLISIAFVVVAAIGCSTAPSRFFSLDSTATADGTPATSATVMVGRVTIPASVDQPDFVVQVAPNRVEVNEFNRWVSPLGDGMARTVAGDLVVLLGTQEVASGQLADCTPDYRVTIDVQRIESVQGQQARLEAVWTVRKTAGGEIRSGRTVAREPVQGQGFDALAAAHTQAIARMSGDIAAAIRAEAEQKSEAIKS